MIRKILFLASNPTDTGRLRLDKEVREIEDGLRLSKERDHFNLVPRFAVRVEDLRRTLLEYSPRIVHFSGHGAGADGILVENDQGEAFEVPNDALAKLFELCAGPIECVVLNACYSDAQADAIAKHIPYPHSIMVPLLEDRAEIDVTQAFRDEGVDIDGLILLSNGQWEGRDTFVAPSSDGLEERMTGPEMQERWKKCLGRFQEEIGTLVGEISFTMANDAGPEREVKFHAPVYLSNVGRKGILKPSTFTYDTAFETQNTNYLRRVPISHTLQPGEADRFTIKVAVPQSSFHRFHATLRDISGLALRSLSIEMNCFVPRSRRQFVQQLIARLSSA